MLLECENALPHVSQTCGFSPTGQRERLAARVADMRLLTRMCPRVPSQVMCQRERLAAGLADMRLLPRMCPHVVHQVAGRRERLAACLADMRLLPRMRPHVLDQVAGRREPFATPSPWNDRNRFNSNHIHWGRHPASHPPSLALHLWTASHPAEACSARSEGSSPAADQNPHLRSPFPAFLQRAPRLIVVWK